MNTDKKYSVYRHTNLINNKVYIGITRQKPENRWGYNGSNYKSTPHFWNAIQEYGWNNFSHDVLYSGLDKDEACKIEQDLIREYKSQDNRYGYNIMSGGTMPDMPQSVRDILSKKLKGNKNGFGKPCSDEKKKKISDAQKGKSLTEEHRRNISLAKKGKTHKPLSQESRKKISDSHKKRSVFCDEINHIFPSIQECSRQTGAQATLICKCCKNKIRSIHGYHFHYVYDIIQMPNDYPVREYTQASGNGSPLAKQGEDIV